jgi:hypothetical protein
LQGGIFFGVAQSLRLRDFVAKLCRLRANSSGGVFIASQVTGEARPSQAAAIGTCSLVNLLPSEIFCASIKAVATGFWSRQQAQ